jgi:hypothetical protein
VNGSNSGKHLRFLLFVTLQCCRSNVSCKKQIAENTFYSVAAQTYFRSWPALCRSQENGNAASFDMSQEINLSLTSVQDQTKAKYLVAGGSSVIVAPESLYQRPRMCN